MLALLISMAGTPEEYVEAAMMVKHHVATGREVDNHITTMLAVKGMQIIHSHAPNVVSQAYLEVLGTDPPVRDNGA